MSSHTASPLFTGYLEFKHRRGKKKCQYTAQIPMRQFFFPQKCKEEMHLVKKHEAILWYHVLGACVCSIQTLSNVTVLLGTLSWYPLKTFEGGRRE